MSRDPHSSAVEDIAIAWLSERDDGFSPAREREFAQWLRADPRHAAAVARIEQTLGLLHGLPEFRAEINAAFERSAPVVPFAPAAAARPPRRSRRLAVWAGAAAALAVAATVGWRTLGEASEVRYATAPVGYERAQLADGSTLELNAASAVRIRFSAGERRVRLEAGEAQRVIAGVPQLLPQD